MAFKPWKLSEFDRDEANNLIEKYECGAVTALLLSSRGITKDEDVRAFFSDSAELIDPFTLPDMDIAVDRIATAMDMGEKICVYGDFDADGITSTALLYSYLRNNGADVTYYIPDRMKEGYGLNNDAIKHLSDTRNIDLLITVDNGITANEQIDYAISLGIDVVVTDHHMQVGDLPNAVAVVDPHRFDSECEYDAWAGVGVVFKLVCALDGDEDIVLQEYSDLAAIGTVADIVSLLGENRNIVKYGLKRINASSRLGLGTLRGLIGAYDKEITSNEISFQIAPRLNASGRMGDASRAVELLITDDADIAVSLAEEICEANTQRVSIENDILEAAVSEIEENEIYRNKIIVARGYDWHSGVVGIVASKLVERYSKPCIVLNIDKDNEIAVGSCRSVEGFSIFEALCSCNDLLVKFGGHTMAAGLSVKLSDLDEFIKRINKYASDNYYIMPSHSLNVDFKINPSSISVDMLKELDAFKPFGADNAVPVFGLCKMKILAINSLSDNKHIKFTLAKGDKTIHALYFGHSTFDVPFQKGDLVNVAVTLERSYYYGKETVSVLIKSIKYYGPKDEELIYQKNVFENWYLNKLQQKDLSLINVSRKEVAIVYRFLRYYNGWEFDYEGMYALLSKYDITFVQMLLCIDIMVELGLVYHDTSRCRIDIPIEPKKVDLNNSRILRKIQSQN